MASDPTSQDLDDGGPVMAPEGAGAGDAGGSFDVVITGEDWLDAICPLLRARDGSWRSASPAREHRCWATDPPSELQVLTQQRLCLVRAHGGCERFLHARELRAASLAPERSAAGPQRRRSRRSSRGHTSGLGAAIGGSVAGALARARTWPRVVRIGIVVVSVAGVVLAASVIGGGPGGGPLVPSAPPSVPASGGPALSPPADDPSVGPDGLRRYRVRQGDTLRTIADRFGVSVRQLRSVNDLGDPPRLQPGDVILVPAPG